MKKIVYIFLPLFVITILLTGCQQYTDGAATTGYAFVQKLTEKNYEEAYNYIYSFSPDVQNKGDFTTRYTNIYDVLQIGDISLLSRNVEKISETEYKLKYSLKMDSKLIGAKSYNFEADIVAGPNGYNVIYTPSLILPQLEEGDKVINISQTGKRGEIFSIDGELLAKNDYAQSICLDLEKTHDIEQIKEFLYTNYDVAKEVVQKKYDNALENGFSLEVFAVFPKDSLTVEQQTAISAIPGLLVDEERHSPLRYYPLKDAAAHVAGYIGSPTEAQIEQYKDYGITESSLVGQFGIEGALEEQLRSKDGRMLYIEDDMGNIKEVLYEDEKIDGADVVLTIDSQVQKQAYTALASNLTKGQSGTLTVMNYKTGDVVGMVSYPSFDNNLFNYKIPEDLWKFYNDEENGYPLILRATQSTFAPGSTFKMFSGVPAIESGILTDSSSPNLSISDNKWNPANDGYKWNYPTINRLSQPDQFIYEYAIKSSDNIFFAYYAMQVGIENFMAYMTKIGIGEAPNFELPVKKSNLLNEGTEMNIKILADMGYGMGELLISPLQMTSMYSAIMNNGNMLNPSIVKRIEKTTDGAVQVLQENSPTIFKENTMQPSTIEMEKIALRRVMVDGTGYPANLKDSDVMGKTGTAVIGKKREVSWFIAISNEEATPYIYTLVIDTKANEGNAKFDIMRAMIRPDDYAGAVMDGTLAITKNKGSSNTEDEPINSPTPTQEGNPDNE